MQQLCTDTGCSPEDLPEAMDDREEWRNRVRDIRADSATWWWISVILICKQIITTHNNNERQSSLEKYTSHFIERVVYERELETEQNCNILTPTLLAITTFLSHSPGLLNRGPGGPAFLGHVPQSSIFSPTGLISKLLGAGFLYRILSPTDWISCALSYIIVQRPPSTCWQHKLHSFNPSTVNVILCYSSTRYTCYLYRCISYFDSLPGS